MNGPGARQPQLPTGRPAGGPMGNRMNAEKPKNTRRTLVRLSKYIGRSRYILLALLILTLLIAAIELTGPLLQGNAIDAIEPVYYNAAVGEDAVIHNYDANDPPVADGENEAHMDVKVRYVVHFMPSDYVGRNGHTVGILGNLLAMGILFLVCALLHFFQSLLSAKLSQRTVYTMGNELFRKIAHLPISYTDTHKHGDIMSRMTNDVENISNAISSSISLLFSGLLTIIGALVMMFILSPVMTLVALITIPLSITVSTKLAKHMRGHFIARQRLTGALNGTVEEMVTSYGTVVAYSKEQKAIDTFAKISASLRDTSVKARVWGSIMGPIMNFLGNLQYVLVAATGGAMILFGGSSISVGNIQSMLSYSKSFTRPINQIANQYSAILTALAGAERFFEIMDSSDEIDEGTLALTPEQVIGNIEFQRMHFSYKKGEPVLRGIDLSVGKGQKIAIVGATGSGKTTIVNLLMRFYEPDSGKILMDGVNIADIPKADLRHTISIVLQDTVLFRDTIRANIKYGRPTATDEEMEEAARHARADSFIRRLPDGYDTVLAEGGSNLSQGQRQLLAIARAVLADPKILILDEATSSVDTRTEMKIQQAMVALMKNRTSLIIAHRLSTIRDADRIIVLRNGEIVEEGNHEALLARGGEYAKLYETQFAGMST